MGRALIFDKKLVLQKNNTTPLNLQKGKNIFESDTNCNFKNRYKLTFRKDAF